MDSGRAIDIDRAIEEVVSKGGWAGDTAIWQSLAKSVVQEVDSKAAEGKAAEGKSEEGVNGGSTVFSQAYLDAKSQRQSVVIFGKEFSYGAFRATIAAICVAVFVLVVAVVIRIVYRSRARRAGAQAGGSSGRLPGRSSGRLSGRTGGRAGRLSGR